jgi:hypothetical protein
MHARIQNAGIVLIVQMAREQLGTGLHSINRNKEWGCAHQPLSFPESRNIEVSQS